MTQLDACNLSFRRGGEWLFRGLSFQIAAAQMLWVRGTNGSGKTTLLRVLAGLSRADEGVVALGNSPSPGEAVSTTGRLYIGHLNGLKDDLTATESLQFLAAVPGCDSSSSAVHAALRHMGVHHRRHAYVRTLSQGQRRRVALARLVLDRSPKLWILDEPFDALDAAAIDTVCDVLRGHLSRGASVVYTSHIAVDGRIAHPQVLDLDQCRAAQG